MAVKTLLVQKGRYTCEANGWVAPDQSASALVCGTFAHVFAQGERPEESAVGVLCDRIYRVCSKDGRVHLVQCLQQFLLMTVSSNNRFFWKLKVKLVLGRDRNVEKFEYMLGMIERTDLRQLPQS